MRGERWARMLKGQQSTKKRICADYLKFKVQLDSFLFITIAKMHFV